MVVKMVFTEFDVVTTVLVNGCGLTSVPGILCTCTVQYFNSIVWLFHLFRKMLTCSLRVSKEDSYWLD